MGTSALEKRAAKEALQEKWNFWGSRGMDVQKSLRGERIKSNAGKKRKYQFAVPIPKNEKHWKDKTLQVTNLTLHTQNSPIMEGQWPTILPNGQQHKRYCLSHVF